MTNSKSSVGVLGGGISGLCAAHFLMKQGIDVSIYEQNDVVGGSIRTVQKNDWLIEKGPNTIMVRSEKVWKLLEELELDAEMIEANREAKKRYIVKDGEPTPLPMSLWDFISTDILSGSAKLRLFKEPFINAADKKDESIADFIKRRFGQEVLDYAINPFVAGIFAGDPKKLSVKQTFNMLYELEREYGSVSRGMIKRDKKKTVKKALISFVDGLQVLPRTLGDILGESLKLNHRVKKIQKSGDKWSLQFQNGETATHDIVIACLPAHTLSEVMQGEEEKPYAQKLKEIPYAPMSIIHLGYKEKKIHHSLDGFGLLVPEVEDFEILGTLFSSSLFPGRAPVDHALLTTFVGGSRNPAMARLEKDELVAKVQLELDQLLGISGTPEFVRHTFWEKAIPQYEVGYDTYLETMEEAEENFPGLFFAGNIRGGVSVPDCITNGLETAEKAATLLKG